MTAPQNAGVSTTMIGNLSRGRRCCAMAGKGRSSQQDLREENLVITDENRPEILKNIQNA